MALRILLADDHQVMRQGLKLLLEREGLEVVGETSDGLEAVRLARSLHPDVGILDLSMPIMNGLAAAGEILRDSPQTRVILLTMYTEDSQVLGALRAGIRGYVLKTQMADELILAIKEVSQGRIYLSPSISENVVQAYLNKADISPITLSHRELQVLQLLAEGKSTKETADLLGISVKTIETHRYRMMEKLHTHDMAGLVRQAIRWGLIQL